MKRWRELAAFATALAVFACSFEGQPCFPTSPGSGAEKDAGAAVLQPRYVLLQIGTNFPPTTTLATNGDSIRIYADTLYVNVDSLTYTQATRVGRFVGFPAESISVEHRAGVVGRTGNLGNTLSFSVLIGGAGSSTVSLGTDITINVVRTGGIIQGAWRYIAH